MVTTLDGGGGVCSMQTGGLKCTCYAQCLNRWSAHAFTHPGRACGGHAWPRSGLWRAWWHYTYLPLLDAEASGAAGDDAATGAVGAAPAEFSSSLNSRFGGSATTLGASGLFSSGRLSSFDARATTERTPCAPMIIGSIPYRLMLCMLCMQARHCSHQAVACSPGYACWQGQGLRATEIRVRDDDQGRASKQQHRFSSQRAPGSCSILQECACTAAFIAALSARVAQPWGWNETAGTPEHQNRTASLHHVMIPTNH